MASPEDDPLLAQLRGQSQAAELGGSDDLLGQLNYTFDTDPLANVEYTDPQDTEEDSKRELTAIQQAFRDRAKREQERYELAVDSE